MSAPLKQECTSEARKIAERLPSLFTNTRDFSLKTNPSTNPRQTANKKNDVRPNLNVTRNKNADKPSEVSQTEQKGPRGGRKPKERATKSNNANNKNSNLIQTMGFLSEGIAMTTVSRRSGDTESTKDVTLQKPRIVKRDHKPEKMEIDAEHKTLADLIGDDDNMDEDSKTSSSDDFLPIKIKDPNKRSLEANIKLLNIDKIKKESDEVELAIPSESLIANGTVDIKTEPDLEVKSEYFHRMDKLFDASPSDFLLFQLPDALPGRAPDVDPQQLPASTSTSKAQVENLCSLEHMEDGMIGKLIRYKSGITKLLIGDTLYDLDLGLTSDFNQHAVTLNANTNERSASMYSLGQINAKLNVKPDWEHLFHKMTP